MTDITARQALTDAIRYWEPRRLAYNGILLLIVVGVFVFHLPSAHAHADLNVVLVLFLLAVLANVAYCACYVVDVTVQISGFRDTWIRFRWMLALIGTAFAAVLTYFFSLGMFGNAP